jgi:hypothetical protein
LEFIFSSEEGLDGLVGDVGGKSKSRSSGWEFDPVQGGSPSIQSDGISWEVGCGTSIARVLIGDPVWYSGNHVFITFSPETFKKLKELIVGEEAGISPSNKINLK